MRSPKVAMAATRNFIRSLTRGPSRSLHLRGFCKILKRHAHQLFPPSLQGSNIGVNRPAVDEITIHLRNRRTSIQSRDQSIRLALVGGYGYRSSPALKTRHPAYNYLSIRRTLNIGCQQFFNVMSPSLKHGQENVLEQQVTRSSLSTPKATSIHLCGHRDFTRRAFRREHPHVSATRDAVQRKRSFSSSSGDAAIFVSMIKSQQPAPKNASSTSAKAAGSRFACRRWLLDQLTSDLKPLSLAYDRGHSCEAIED